MTGAKELEARYIGTVEKMARQLAFGDDPAGRKWHIQGGMLRMVKEWYQKSIPLSVVYFGQKAAIEKYRGKSRIAPLFLHHHTLDRYVDETLQMYGYGTKMNPYTDIPPANEIEAWVEERLRHEGGLFEHERWGRA